MNVEELLAACKDGNVYLHLPDQGLRETLVRDENGALVMKWTWDRDEVEHETPYRPDQEAIIVSEFSALYALAARGAAGLSLEDATEVIDWPQQGLTVYTLSAEQMVELKQRWLQRRAEEQSDPAEAQKYLLHLADADDYVADDWVYRAYGWTQFTEDDFACTAGKTLPRVIGDDDLSLSSGMLVYLNEDDRINVSVILFSEDDEGIETYEFDPDTHDYVDGGQLFECRDLSSLLQAEGMTPCWTWLLSDDVVGGIDDWQELADKVAEDPKALPLDEQVRYVMDVARRVFRLWNEGRVNLTYLLMPETPTR